MESGLLGLFENVPIDEALQQRFLEASKRLTFTKGGMLFRQGEPCSNAYFIRKGLIKLCCENSEGRSFIRSFASEGALVGSLNSQLFDEASTFSAVCLEACIIEAVPYPQLEELMQSNLEISRLACRLFQHLAHSRELHEYRLLCMNTEQRYKTFMQESPVAKRLSPEEIAQYLGVTPVVLDLIHARIA